ncbi:thiamine-phosphate kinase [Candidatus Saganbacteria bacterium]|nr:thiamine-phosphate kinase [Candidatus Saganbacteria bacterium]
MKLTELGEFGLIDLIAKREPKLPSTIIGIGDDAAVIQIQKSKGKSQNYLLITTDAFIENVHFKLKGTSFFALGRKVMAANISDIAAMGGYPTHAVVTVGLPKKLSVKQVRQLYNGIDTLAQKNKIDIVGGDTVASPREVVISITLLGEVEKDRLLTRSGARPGDLILVTGDFGGPASDKFKIQKAKLKIRIKEARNIAKSRGATSMIDSSDGLMRSVLELCKASKTGARIYEDLAPIAKGASLEQALYGGEEYELVFTAPKTNLPKLKKLAKVSVVGEMVPHKFGVMLVDSYGRIKPPKSGGYEHFK